MDLLHRLSQIALGNQGTVIQVWYQMVEEQEVVEEELIMYLLQAQN